MSDHLRNLWTDDAVVYLQKLSEAGLAALSGTGHRSPRLGLGYGDGDRYRLEFFALSHLRSLRRLHDFDLVICGGAEGFDQALGWAAISMGVPLVVAIPFSGQDSKWPDDARARYTDLLAKAEDVVTVCQGVYSPKMFVARDLWMVEAATEMVALWDGNQKSGTASTVKMAGGAGKVVHNLWHDWKV